MYEHGALGEVDGETSSSNGGRCRRSFTIERLSRTWNSAPWFSAWTFGHRGRHRAGAAGLV